MVSKNEYSIPKGRLAVVSAVQDYSKHYTHKVEHFQSPPKKIPKPKFYYRDPDTGRWN